MPNAAQDRRTHFNDMVHSIPPLTAFLAGREASPRSSCRPTMHAGMARHLSVRCSLHSARRLTYTTGFGSSRRLEPPSCSLR
eukprot:9973550-Alexandrium_andersonii.AAC.1